MKIPHSSLTKILAVLVASAAYTALPLSAHEGHDKMAAAAMPGELVRVDDKTNASWLAKERTAYPMDSCAVSGDKFDGGDMGKSQDYIYKQEGKPDRLVRFCCKDCVNDFKKEPAKYLKMIDDAAAAKASGAKK